MSESNGEVSAAELRRAWNRCHRGVAELHDEVEALKEKLVALNIRLDDRIDEVIQEIRDRIATAEPVH